MDLLSTDDSITAALLSPSWSKAAAVAKFCDIGILGAQPGIAGQRIDRTLAVGRNVGRQLAVFQKLREDCCELFV